MNWISGYSEVEQGRKVLERMATLLLSLAYLADRAAILPDLLRSYMLGILARDEEVA